MQHESRKRRSVTVASNAGLGLRAYLAEQKKLAPPTPARIAREVGCSRAWVWEVLNGRGRPSSEFIAACARLGIPPEVFR